MGHKSEILNKIGQITLPQYSTSYFHNVSFCFLVYIKNFFFQLWSCMCTAILGFALMDKRLKEIKDKRKVQEFHGWKAKD